MPSISVKNTVIDSKTPRIAVSITVQSLDEITRQLAAIQVTPPDIVEWRVDYMQPLPDQATVQAVKDQLTKALPGIPVIATFRSSAEGGATHSSEADYFRIVNHLINTRFDILDLEITSHDSKTIQECIERVHANSGLVIGSYHNFTATPKQTAMLIILAALRQSGSDIAKVAVMPQSKGDVLQFMNTMQHVNSAVPLVAIAMGSLGTLTRIAPTWTQSAITFGSLDQSKSSAPGQIPVPELRKILSITEDA